MRGMANGEPIVSQAMTEEARETLDNVYGRDRKPIRGKWIATPSGGVPADQYVPEARALDAPIMAGRFYEGAQATDGTDIGSRARHKAYMREHGLTTVDDYSDGYRKNLAAREQERQKKSRRDALARAMYKIDKP